MNLHTFLTKSISFKDFSSILSTDKSYNKKLINFLVKKRISVIVYTKNRKKYVFIANPAKKEEITNFIKTISQIFSNTRRKKKIFIHSHGVNGYKYDLINYFTNNEFINSIKDKDICIFFNNCASLPIPFAETFKRHVKKSINRQEYLINTIIKAIYGNIDLILSGFSYGCVLNTYILNSIDDNNLKKINNIFLIEEGIPKIKYLIEQLKTRYNRLKCVCGKKNILKKVRLIIITANEALEKYHPINLTFDLVNIINHDNNMQQKLHSCILIDDNNFYKKKIFLQDYFVKIKKLSELKIKFCPQKNKIW